MYVCDDQCLCLFLKSFFAQFFLQTFAEHFFQTPLKVFIDKKLDESFAQFVQFFNSVVEVVRSPGSGE